VAGSPDWTEQLIDAAISAIVSIDASGHVVRFNPAAEVMFGYSREEALGRRLADLVVPQDLQAAHSKMLERLATGDPEPLLGRRVAQHAVRKDGDDFPVEWTLVQTNDTPPEYTWIVRDLSRVTEAEERSTRMARLLASSEELADMGSWELDLASREGLWSDQMYRIHGYEPGAVHPTVELFMSEVHPDDRDSLRSLFQTLARSPEKLMGDGVMLEYRVVRRDGSVREIVGRGRVEADHEGRPARWVGCAQDVTDQRLTERELQAHYALGQALRDWQTFDEGVVDLLRRLGTALDYCAGSLWVMDPKQEQLWCRAFWTVPGSAATELEATIRTRTYAPGEGIPGRAWAEEEPVFTEDDGSEPALAGLRFGIAFPALGDDGPLAVLSFRAPDRREATERLARTLSGIGRELGRFLSQRRSDLGAAPLSERELEVLRLAADGNSGPEIAERLVLSPATVKTHFENIYEKLGVSDGAAAVAHAFRIGLLR
jgi:PAS domain S-box-containing protein